MGYIALNYFEVQTKFIFRRDEWVTGKKNILAE